MSNTAETMAAEQFAAYVTDHQMTVLHDDGLYRHLRFGCRGAVGWFEIVTWPGTLTIHGDLGGTHTFSRLTDMFEFFRDRPINPGYWAEKTPDYGISLREYSEDVFREQVVDALADLDGSDEETTQAAKRILTALDDGDAHDEDGAHELLRDGKDAGLWSDSWERDLTYWSLPYLRACHGIVWAIRQYDAAKSPAMPVVG